MAGRAMFRIYGLVLVAMMMSGCEGRLLVFGNMFFMGIACALLWSTVNFKSSD